jgi:hypothetical protein
MLAFTLIVCGLMVALLAKSRHVGVVLSFLLIYSGLMLTFVHLVNLVAEVTANRG